MYECPLHQWFQFNIFLLGNSPNHINLSGKHQYFDMIGDFCPFNLNHILLIALSWLFQDHLTFCHYNDLDLGLAKDSSKRGPYFNKLITLRYIQGIVIILMQEQYIYCEMHFGHCLLYKLKESRLYPTWLSTIIIN